MRIAVRNAAASVLTVSLILTGLLWSSSPATAAEDETSSPSVAVMLNSADELLADAAYLLNLTDPTEKKQWPVLQSYLEVFLIGVDRTLPSRIDIFFGDKAERYVSSFPIGDRNDFLKKNLKPLGIDSKLLRTDFYQLGRGRKQDPFNGFLLYVSPYAMIAEREADLDRVPHDPRQSFAALLAKSYAFAVEAHNKKSDAQAQADRRKTFQATRAKSLAALKKDKGESDDDFQLRKKALDLQMDEIEWFFAESEHVMAGLTIDRNKGLGRVDIELTPIAGSPLALTIAQLGVKASYFANVDRSSDPILYGRVNHPLNDLRKKNGRTISSLIQDRLKSRLEANEKRTADEKAAGKQLIDKIFETVNAGIDAGLADGFVDVHPSTGGKNAFLLGLRAADGTKVVDILNLVPKARPGATVKIDADDESGVKIHSIDLAKETSAAWSDLIGAGTVYVGSSKDAVWCAAGEGALDALKAAIKKSHQPPAAGAEKAPWAELIVRLKPWIQEAAGQVPVKKGEGNYRKMAVSALEAGDDKLTVQMTRPEGGKVLGQIELQTGLLRFAGKAAADFSRENLDESSQNTKK